MVDLTSTVIIVIGGTVLGALLVFCIVLLVERRRLMLDEGPADGGVDLTSQRADHSASADEHGLFEELNRAIDIAIGANQGALDTGSEQIPEIDAIEGSSPQTPSMSSRTLSVADASPRRGTRLAIVGVGLLCLASAFTLGPLAAVRAEPMTIVSHVETPVVRCFDTHTVVPEGCVEVAAPGRWVGLEGGSFFMGTPLEDSQREDDEVRHGIRLTHSFLIQATEVTQAQFLEVMGYNPSRYTDCGGECPVEQVNWHQAAVYTNLLSQREGLDECYSCIGVRADVECSSLESPYRCNGYRLPTEAEWEYAARAGQAHKPMSTSELNAVAWYLENSRVHYENAWPIADGSGPQRVAQRRDNEWGLYDSLGNVAEWCHDWYSTYAVYGTIDPYGAGTGEGRVIRGGSWWDPLSRVRVPLRGSVQPNSRSDTVGFRVVRTL